MKTPTVKIMIGIPGSGKSTYSLNFIKENPNWIRMNRDDFRFMFKNIPFCDNKTEELITDIINSSVISALNKGLNVIIDNTNVREKYINNFIDLVITKANVEFQIMDITIDEAIERDSKREKSVGKEVIEKMFENYQNLIKTFDFTPRKKQNYIYENPIKDPSKEDVILCDIDGTLAHMNGKRGPFDWNKVDLDDVDEVVADRLRKHKLLNEKVFIVSGRDEVCKELTVQWLEKHNISFDGIYMRKHNDNRKDSIIKQEIYDNYIKEKYNVLFVYDDRNQVVNQWRKNKLKVFQVEDGNF